MATRFPRNRVIALLLSLLLLPCVRGTAAWSTADFSGLWAVCAVSSGGPGEGWSYGTLLSDGTGAVLGGLLTDQNGAADAVSPGACAVTNTAGWSAAFTTASLRAWTLSGAMNEGRNLVAATGSAGAGEPAMAILLKTSSGCSNADFAGTWDYYAVFTAEPVEVWERGSLSADGAGNVTAWTATDNRLVARGGPIAAGLFTYAVAADGRMTASWPTAGTDCFGALSASKDVAVWTMRFDFARLALVVLVRRSGTYGPADFSGTWQWHEIASGGGLGGWEGWYRGRITADGATHVAALPLENSDGAADTEGEGLYALAPDGSGAIGVTGLGAWISMSAARDVLAGVTEHFNSLAPGDFGLTLAVRNHAAFATVDEWGGQVLVPDAAHPLFGTQVSVPGSALAGDTRVGFDALADHPAAPADTAFLLTGDGADQVVEFSPPGLGFAAPASIVLPYPADTDGDDVRVYSLAYDEQDLVWTWTRLPVFAVDEYNRTVTVRVSTLAPLALAVSTLPPPPASGGGGSCFIATAAFGSPLAGAVAVLRTFRDRFLLTSPAGRRFTAWYYRHGPAPAAVIARRPVLRAAVRVLLLPAVLSAWLAVTGLWLPALCVLAAAALLLRRAPTRT